MASLHAIVLPFPAQGHVIPLMELSHRLVEHGFEITFVNTEFIHDRVLDALAKQGGTLEGIRMVSIPDGLGPAEDRNDLAKLTEGFSKVMQRHLEELIRKINESEGNNKIRWMIADGVMGWSSAVAKRMGVRVALFSTISTALIALRQSIPKLIEDGILDARGLPKRHEIFQLSPGMPTVNTTELPWNCCSDLEGQEAIFQLALETSQDMDRAEIIISNSFHEGEPEAFAIFPNILPVGPLLAERTFKKPAGYVWPEDMTCMNWLSEQPAKSVIYVAFGSHAIFDDLQFQELAHGLEHSGRPFLWAARPDSSSSLSKDWLNEFECRVSGKGKVVGWSPQQQVLAHPSVACFLSHCGWNSIMEGLCNGVPFLCMPYFADQFFNASYVCNVWKTGLKLTPDKAGIIAREQIKIKVEELLENDEIKRRATFWKDIARRSIGRGGSSHDNFNSFVNAVIE